MYRDFLSLLQIQAIVDGMGKDTGQQRRHGSPGHPQ